MQAKPFIKWVGGKSKLLTNIGTSILEISAKMDTVNYVEPFLGGGSVMWWVLQNVPNLSRVVVNDCNSDLVLCYNMLKYNSKTLTSRLIELSEVFLKLDAESRKEFYYKIRRMFNEGCSDNVERAAQFIFLNKTGFNGLFRVNSKGSFNVPCGRYANPKILNESNLSVCSYLLSKVDVLNRDFYDLLPLASANTIFYLDPPYRPVSYTSSFVSYTDKGFSDLDQIRLSEFCSKIDSMGAYFILSNSDPQELSPEDTFLLDLYGKFNVRRVRAPRNINCDSSKRGKVSELIISNF